MTLKKSQSSGPEADTLILGLGAWVTPGYLRALGARPVLGRILDDSDGQPGAPPVAVLGHDL